MALFGKISKKSGIYESSKSINDCYINIDKVIIYKNKAKVSLNIYVDDRIVDSMLYSEIPISYEGDNCHTQIYNYIKLKDEFSDCVDV